MIPFPDAQLDVLQDLADALMAAPDDAIRSASLDPAELTTPGVWLRLTGLDYTFGGVLVQLQLCMVVGDTDGGIRVVRQLATLHNAVAGVLNDPELGLFVTTTGTPTAATVILADTPTPLPALVVPITISA